MLERFMPSVVLHTVADIIVADNGSTDSSLEFLRANYPQVRLVELDRNYGFADGYNRAIAQLDGYDYYVLLNSDVECTPHWVEPIVELMEQQPKVAVVQPKLLMYDRKDTFEYAGGAGGFIDSYGYPFCRGRLFSSLEKDHGQYDDTRDIFWATGAAMFVRASVWNELGGLDGDFFAHMEEIDLCWRIRLAGNDLMMVPASQVYHLGGGSLAYGNPRKTYLNFRNNLLLLHKNLPHDEGKRLLLVRRLMDTLAFGMALAKFHFGDARAIIRAHRDFRKMRKNYTSQPTVNLLKQLPEERVNIITAHYLRGVKHFTDLKLY
jgi:GT2 family glycosyltransferase